MRIIHSVMIYDTEKRHPRDPLVKKIIAILIPRGNQNNYNKVYNILEYVWGAPERISPKFPFDWTNYYSEISPNLDRIFFSYAGLYPMSKLVEWKLKAREIENMTGTSRTVNIDPGTLDGARLILASTKGQAHRIYLNNGIFAEVTLCKRKGKWTSFFYTFPDFKSGAYDNWLDTVRADWKKEHYLIQNKK